MISNQEDVKLDFEVKEEDMPKADADLSHTLDSIERMLSLSPNKEVLKNLLDVVVSNEGVSENPDQASRLDQLKVKIVAKLGGEISESASCGATSSCSIATVAEPLTSGKKKKAKPIRRKIVGIDALSFMECVNNDIPSVVRIRDVVFKNSLVGKHSVLMANECVVPVYGKEKINNLVKKYYLDGEDFEICESVISPVDYLIMRGEIICESDDLKFDDKKAQQEKYSIDDEVINFIAEKIDTNIREMEGILSKVFFFATLLGKKSATLEEAYEAMKENMDEIKEGLSPDMVIDTVCKYFNISKNDIVGKKKNKEIVEPRMICIYLICELLDLPLVAIGKKFGDRDHTTIMHARDKITEQIKTNNKIKVYITDIKDLLTK